MSARLGETAVIQFPSVFYLLNFEAGGLTLPDTVDPFVTDCSYIKNLFQDQT